MACLSIIVRKMTPNQLNSSCWASPLAICAYRAHFCHSSIKNAIRIYIYRYVRHTLVAAVLGLRNVGGVKCQPFLKNSNHWKRPLKMIFKGSGCFQFSEAVITSIAKESLRSTERGSPQVLAVL